MGFWAYQFPATQQRVQSISLVLLALTQVCPPLALDIASNYLDKVRPRLPLAATLLAQRRRSSRCIWRERGTASTTGRRWSPRSSLSSCRCSLCRSRYSSSATTGRSLAPSCLPSRARSRGSRGPSCRSGSRSLASCSAASRPAASPCPTSSRRSGSCL